MSTAKLPCNVDVVALGELLIDFTENGVSEQGNPLLEANPGGAPCNVLSMLTRFGKTVGFIGKVGNDGFGKMLKGAIAEQGILTEGLCFDNDVHTTLALVLKLENGDRDFAFYRKPGADMNLRPEEVDTDLIRSARLFHFGSLSLTDEPVRSATKKALETAEDAGLMISFDPNLREPLWETMDQAKEQIDFGMKHAHVLKISDNEITWFTGKEDYEDGIRYLQETYPNLKLICLSMGPDGSRACFGDLRVDVPAFLQEKTIETTGAGDTFCACMLNTVLDKGLDDLSEDDLREMLTTANAAASLVTTKKGALRVMPQLDEVKAFIAERTQG
ncbi:MAG: carbohydrate kinase [Erysipelotrichaceae bacterium]|nr:carbohydrate kinase [Erysipelotrichaceae bacterium]